MIMRRSTALSPGARSAAEQRSELPREKPADMGGAGRVGMQGIGKLAWGEFDPLRKIDASLARLAAKRQGRPVDRHHACRVKRPLRADDLLPSALDQPAIHTLLRDVDRLRTKAANQLCQTAQALPISLHLLIGHPLEVRRQDRKSV